MRAVVQRVSEASVTVAGERVARIDAGLLAYVGAGAGDGEDQARRLARKIAHLRIFAGEGTHFARSLLDTGGEALVVSQFTLYADCRKGRRPSFTGALDPKLAAPLLDRFAELLGAEGIRVYTGRFGANMEVTAVNLGPVTIVLDTDSL